MNAKYFLIKIEERPGRITRKIVASSVDRAELSAVLRDIQDFNEGETEIRKIVYGDSKIPTPVHVKWVTALSL